MAIIVNNVFNTAYSPYGNGSASYSPIIALGESWAYYMGHFMADLRYGLQSSQPKSEQGINFYNSTSASAHINVLEGFNPNYTADPFKWIPKGIYLDLRDATVENTPVIDQVSNYTNQQLFNVFLSSVTTLPAYKTKLLQATSNSTSANVPNLFAQYGY